MGGNLSPPSYAFMAYTGQNLPLLLGTITFKSSGVAKVVLLDSNPLGCNALSLGSQFQHYEGM